jgi:2-methylisocitrate lyase-like PEP mutase family enzyme
VPTNAEKRRAFKQALAGPDLVLAPGVSDPVSARLVQRAGLLAIHASGSVAHRTAGYADAGILDLSEMVERITALADAIDIPVIADADTGFGNVVNVVRTIKEYERAGAAAVHIEDQVTPKRPVHMPGVEGETITRQELVNKIRAAVDARTDEGFLIIARSEVKGNPEEVRERLAECVEAGADIAWISGGTEDNLRALRKAIPARAPLLGVLPRNVPAPTWKSWGADCGVLPGVMQVAALYAQEKLLEELKKTGTTSGYFTALPDVAPIESFYSKQGSAEMDDIMSRFGG